MRRAGDGGFVAAVDQDHGKPGRIVSPAAIAPFRFARGANEAPTSHLLSRLARRREASRERMARPIRTRPSRTVKGLSRPSWPRDGGIDEPSPHRRGDGRRRWRAYARRLGSWDLVAPSMGVPIRLSRMSHPERPTSKEADPSGWMEGSRPGCTLYRPLTPHSAGDETMGWDKSQYVFFVCPTNSNMGSRFAGSADVRKPPSPYTRIWPLRLARMLSSQWVSISGTELMSFSV